MNRSIQNLLSITLVLLLSCGPVFAQRRGGGSARTSVNHPSQGNINRNNNVNSNRNVNANINRNVNVNVHHDVDVHHSYYGGGCCYHPVAVAAAVTATAMVVGSIVYSLPPACSVVVMNGLTYQHCGSTWYQPQFVGTSTTYVVVAAP